MTNYSKKVNANWQDGLCLILGIVLFLSPWILGFAGLSVAMWNAVAFGVIIALMAIAAMVEFHDWEEWVDMAIGVWLVVSPWVLGFAVLTGGEIVGASVATWTFVVAGVLALALSAWSLRAHHEGMPS